QHFSCNQVNEQIAHSATPPRPDERLRMRNVSLLEGTVGCGVWVGSSGTRSCRRHGPYWTYTALVCWRKTVPSPRTEFAPSGAQVGTWTETLALPVLLVTTVASVIQWSPCCQRMRTVSPLA